MNFNKINISIEGYILSIYIYFLLLLNNHVAPILYYLISMALTVSLFLCIFKKILDRKNNDLFLIVSLTILAILISGFFKGGLIQTGPNNDIFNWALSSNTISGYANYSHIMPVGQQIWDGVRQDAFGSYIINGIFPTLFFRNTLEFSIINILIITILYQVIFYKILALNGFERSTSILISILIIGNPLFLYITSNYFLGQLLGGFFIIFASYSYLYANKHNFNRLERILITFPWVFLSLISYQSGFIAYLICALLITCTLNYHRINTTPSIARLFLAVKYLLRLLFDTAIIIGICAVLYPPLITHFYNQSISAAKIIAGWSLPTQTPQMLLGWPTIIPVQAVWQKPQILILVFLLFYIVFILKNKIKHFSYILLVWLFLYLIYFLSEWFLPRENNYQYWKAASFILLPLGLIVTGTMINGFLNTNISRIIAISICYIFCLISFSNVSSQYFFSYTPIYRNLTELRTEDNIANIVLDTDDWVDTFIAFNVLSKNNFLYPLNKWYGPSVNIVDIVSPIDFYVVRNCAVKNDPLHKYNLTSKDESMDYFFGTENCGLLSKLLTWDNLYDAEVDGRWSKERVLNFKLAHPVFLNDKLAELSFDVLPFIPVANKPQNFDVYLDEKLIKSYSIKEGAKIQLSLVLKSSGANKITFKFNNSGRPSDFIANSSDTREVALFFTSAHLSFLNK